MNPTNKCLNTLFDNELISKRRRGKRYDIALCSLTPEGVRGLHHLTRIEEILGGRIDLESEKSFEILVNGDRPSYDHLRFIYPA